jgi:hypothetical protein
MEFQGGSDIWVVQTMVTSIYDIIAHEKILGRKVMRLTLWEDKLPNWNMANGSLRFAIADLISFAYRKNHKILYIWGWFICCIMLLPYGFHKIFDKLYHRKCYWCLAKEKDLSFKPFWICISLHMTCNEMHHDIQSKRQLQVQLIQPSSPGSPALGGRIGPCSRLCYLLFFVSNLPALKPLPTCH